MKTSNMKPGFRKLVRTLREQKEPAPKLSDEQILAWAERHDVGGTLTDLRCMIEDAATLTPNAEVTRA